MYEKRMVSNTGYEVIQSMRIGGKEILLAENMRAEDGQIYFVCGYRENGIIGEYSQAVTSGDYLETVREFAGRINDEAERIRAEHTARGLPSDLFTAEQCYLHDYGEDIEGKVIAMKAEVFSPEYRRGDNQLVLVTGGFGAHANSRGSAVYCYHLNNGEHTRFERREVLGVVKDLPDWAKERLTAIKARIAAEHAKSKIDRGDAR